MKNLPTIPNKLLQKWIKNNKIYASSNTEIRNIEKDMYGVFAKQDISMFSEIEYIRCLELGHKSNYQHDPVIKARAKKHTCYCEDCKIHGNRTFVPTGHFNSYRITDNINNTNIDSFFISNHNLLIVYSLKEIKKGDELVIYLKISPSSTEKSDIPPLTPTD
jgi:hypothetical protein